MNNCANDDLIHFGQQAYTQQCYNNASSASSAQNSSNGQTKSADDDDAFANIFSTNLDDLLEFNDEYTICEETEEQISEAMNLPQEQRDRRLEEIQQHVRYLKGQEKRKKIINQKNHRPFDDSNVGLCSVCMDDHFQIIQPYGKDLACEQCFRKIMAPQINGAATE